MRSGLATNAVYSTTNTIKVIDMLTGVETTVRAYIPGTVDYDFVPGAAAYDEVTGKYILVGNPTAGRTYERFNPQIYSSGNVGGARVALLSRSGTDLRLPGALGLTCDVRDRDAVFAAVALAVWRADGFPTRWPTMPT